MFKVLSLGEKNALVLIFYEDLLKGFYLHSGEKCGDGWIDGFYLGFQLLYFELIFLLCDLHLGYCIHKLKSFLFEVWLLCFDPPICFFNRLG